MLRSVISRSCSAVRTAAKLNARTHAPVVSACKVHTGPPVVPTDEYEDMLVQALNDNNTTGYEIRSIVQRFQRMDNVPDPKVVNALLTACRRVNDYALAVRILEAVKYKCGKKVSAIWPYMLQEIQPTLDDLGILTPEQMGYDKPELYLQDVFDMH